MHILANQEIYYIGAGVIGVYPPFPMPDPSMPVDSCPLPLSGMNGQSFNDIYGWLSGLNNKARRPHISD